MLFTTSNGHQKKVVSWLQILLIPNRCQANGCFSGCSSYNKNWENQNRRTGACYSSGKSQYCSASNFILCSSTTVWQQGHKQQVKPEHPLTRQPPTVPPTAPSIRERLARPAWQQGRKQQVESEHPLTRQPPPAPPSAPPIKERLAPPVADKNNPPIITLDDIFKKTKVAPRIYYMSLNDEEVAKRLASRGSAEN